MRLKTLDLTCPKCKTMPRIKKLGSFVYLKCNCSQTAGWDTFHYALSSWIIKIGENGGFKDYNKIIKKSDL